jgi:hypothetical protein
LSPCMIDESVRAKQDRGGDQDGGGAGAPQGLVIQPGSPSVNRIHSAA